MENILLKIKLKRAKRLKKREAQKRIVAIITAMANEERKLWKTHD